MSRVCFTGRAVIYGESYTRDELERLVASASGIIFERNLSAGTDILVQGPSNNTRGNDSTKTLKARQRGITILNYNQFWDRFGESIMQAQSNRSGSRATIPLPARLGADSRFRDNGRALSGAARPPTPQKTEKKRKIKTPKLSNPNLPQVDPLDEGKRDLDI